MPPLLARALRHVPAAMLTAIVVPAIVFAAPGVLSLDAGNVKLVAALVAGVVAWRWRNTLLTIAVGMAALWLLHGLCANIERRRRRCSRLRPTGK